MIEHAVVIARQGPTGIMSAGELRLAGVDVAIVERRASAELIGSRASGLHARTIEALDQRGIAERFLTEGRAMQVAGLAHIPLDVSDFPTRHNYWIEELAIPVSLGQEVTGFAQDTTGVDRLSFLLRAN